MAAAHPSAPEALAGAVIGRLARTYLAPRWPLLALALAAAATFAGLQGLLLKLLQPAVNDLVAHPKPGALLRIPLLLGALAVGRGLAQVIQALAANRVGNGVVGDLQRDLFAALMGSDLADLRGAHSGGRVTSLIYDAGLVREALPAGLVSLIQQGLALIGALWVMAVMDWRLTAVILLGGPLAATVLRRYSRRTTRAAKGAMDSTADLARAILESLAGVRVVKLEGREAAETERIGQVIARRQAHLVSGDNARATAAPVSETLTMLITAAVLGYEGWKASTGAPDAGAFAAFLAALLVAGQSLRQLANQTTVIAQGAAAGRRLLAALDSHPTITDTPTARALQRVDGHLAFEAVDFAYEPGRPVLSQVSLEVRRGEMVALVGPSGAGKSTLINLAPRFYDVGAGRVSVDGHDVRDVTLASLRAQIALVTQEPFLFDDSVAANIAYARPNASAAEIEAAARAAAAHDFIAALPDGYQTAVGEAGGRLSGGQRQRIAIARAFLKDAPILLLDEATSALDSDSEAQVQAALQRLMAGRATLVIAHRLSTVRDAACIHVLDGGRVVERGDHAALVRAGGLYARLAGGQRLEPAGS
ncbi:ABC transporter ATP-binding protein [Caulobacter sp. KR2-114]|uniref:ABC transporter ATP-binding protein n=1 Tax=Caulobacter sp. KR2-114 TaxID=3400912 RepID=UPI003BFF4E90